MVLIWWEYALIGVLFAVILTVFAAGLFGFVRVRVQKWIRGAIGNFMTNLADQAAEEEGSSSSGSSPGVLELGGFKIDVATIKELLAIAPQALQLAKMFGLTSGGGGASGGGGKIGL